MAEEVGSSGARAGVITQADAEAVSLAAAGASALTGGRVTVSTGATAGPDRG